MSAFTVQAFGEELRVQLAAGARLLNYVDVNAAELHRWLGGYPGDDPRMLNCCSAMYAETNDTDEVRSAPPTGAGASLTIHYRLPR